MFFWLEGAIYTGTIPAIAIAFLIVETTLLLWLYRKQNLNLMIIANALAGGSALVAVYLLATGGPPLTVAGLLVASLVAHFFDLAARRQLIASSQLRGSSAKPAN
ncbi:MAG: hypothetical protein AAFR27_10695 [Pseudomonadota bacterium]